MLEGFLLGIIVACTLAAGTFFLKFWRKTRDPLFLAFGVAFLIEAVNRCFVLFTDRPDEGSPWIYAIRLASAGVRFDAERGWNHLLEDLAVAP